MINKKSPQRAFDNKDYPKATRDCLYLLYKIRE